MTGTTSLVPVSRRGRRGSHGAPQRLGSVLAALTLAALAASPAHAGHVASGLTAQGLLPGSTGLVAPRGDTVPTAAPRAQAAAAGEAPLRVYVVVVDGLLPQEVGRFTPTLSELRAGGTWYEEARAVLPTETLPNHAAMMTGVLPQRSGIVANQIYRRRPNTPREYMQQPEFLEADTLTTRLERAYGGAIATATVLSKEYLFGLFRGEYPGPGDPLPQREADFHWDPRSQPAYIPEPSAHALDAAGMDAFLAWIRAQDGSSLPQFAFVNLGDVDRAGHADESGAATAAADRATHPGEDELSGDHVSPFRQAAIEDTDAQLRRLVEELKQSGAWDETVLIVLSDHGMDWGPSDDGHVAKTGSPLSTAGYPYLALGGGGSELIYVDRRPDIAPMARILMGDDADGVAFVATREPVPGLSTPTFAQLGLDHPYSPEIEAFLKPTYRSSPAQNGCNQCGSANPLPGNHGHSVTQHSALLVAGGHPVLDSAPESVAGERVYRPNSFAAPAGGPGVLSVAPTVAGLFGLGEPAGGYDGPALPEAFDPGALSPRGSGGGGGAGAGGGQGGTAGGGADLFRRTAALRTTLSATPRTARYGAPFTVSGRVVAAEACGGPLRVTLFRGSGKRPAAARVVANAIPVRAGGRWSHRLRATTNAAYFARVQPTRTCDGELSPPVTVPVRARVNVTRGCDRVRGRVLPAAPGTRVVLERLTRRGGRRLGSRRLDARSRFAFDLPTCAGRYRVIWRAQRGRNATGSATFRAGRGT